jgi:hypothetical protein
MICYQHPGQESVGICVNCGKAGCHQCVHTLKDGLHCSGCVQKAVTKIWLKIGISVLFAVAGASGGYYLAHASKQRVTTSLVFNETVVFSYAAWAIFWGWGRVWRIWRWVLNGIGCAANIFLLPIILYLFIAIPFLLASCYGMFGGGVLEMVLVLFTAFQLRRRLQSADQLHQGSLQMAGPQNWPQSPAPNPWSQQTIGQQNQNWPQPSAPQSWGQQNQNWPQPPAPNPWSQQHQGGQ